MLMPNRLRVAKQDIESTIPTHRPAQVEETAGNNPRADRFTPEETKDQRSFSDCGGRECGKPCTKKSDQFRLQRVRKITYGAYCAESGFLDRQVTVQPTDTMAEPVKLNIKQATLSSDRSLRALLV